MPVTLISLFVSRRPTRSGIDRGRFIQEAQRLAPPQRRRWQDIPKERAKYIPINFRTLGVDNALAADAVIEKLKLLEQQNSHHEGHEHAKPHFIGLKKALQIRKTLAQRETVAELIVELNNLRATKEHGYVFDPKVQPGFSHVSYPPTRTGILKWILGSKITFVGIRQPAYKTKVPKIFSKIPIIKKLPLDDLVSEAVNFVTFPWRRRNLNLAYLTDQQMNEIGKKINVEMLKLQRLEQRISKRDERAMYQAYMQLVAGAARKGSGGGREN